MDTQKKKCSQHNSMLLVCTVALRHQAFETQFKDVSRESHTMNDCGLKEYFKT